MNNGTIVGYDGTVFVGDLKLNHGRVIGMAEYVMKLFLEAPAEHFIGTLLYFYEHPEVIENPITVCAYGNSITTHPGQGRLLSSYFRNQKTIKALLVPLGMPKETITENLLLQDVAKNVTLNKGAFEIFEYDNDNHHGISTGEFADYFHVTDIRLAFEKEKKMLVKDLLLSKGKTIWRFPDRNQIAIGKKGAGTTVVECINAEGFYHSLFNIAYGHFPKSKLFSISVQ